MAGGAPGPALRDRLPPAAAILQRAAAKAAVSHGHLVLEVGNRTIARRPPVPRLWQGLDKLKKQGNIFNMNAANHAGSMAGQILSRSAAHGRGWAFTPNDFADVGDPRSVGMALTRLMRTGKIRRIARGLYDQPHNHPLLGRTGATADTVVAAVARKKNLRMLPSAAVAANQLGLSTQVPAQMIYHTDGAAAKVQLGNLNIVFRRNSGRGLALAGRVSGLVAQALRNVGNGKVTAAHLNTLRAGLTPVARKQLREDIGRVPAWMRPHFRDLTRTNG